MKRLRVSIFGALLSGSALWDDVPLGGGERPVLGAHCDQAEISLKPRSVRLPALGTVPWTRQLEMETKQF